MSEQPSSSSAAAPVTDGVARATKPNNKQRVARSGWNDGHRRIVQDVFQAGRQALQANTSCKITLPDGTTVEVAGSNKYSDKSSTAVADRLEAMRVQELEVKELQVKAWADKTQAQLERQPEQNEAQQAKRERRRQKRQQQKQVLQQAKAQQAAQAAAEREAAESAEAGAVAPAAEMQTEQTGSAVASATAEDERMRTLLDSVTRRLSEYVSAACRGKSMATESVDVVFVRSDRVSFPSVQCTVPYGLPSMTAEQLGTAVLEGLGPHALSRACSWTDFKRACQGVALHMVEQAGQEHWRAA